MSATNIHDAADANDDDEEDEVVAIEPPTRMRRSGRGTGRSREPSLDAISRELQSMEARFTMVGLGLLDNADRLRVLCKSLSPSPAP